MYVSIDAISLALEKLGGLHPFFGNTLLACKRAGLPIGRSVPFAIADLEKELIQQYYQPQKDSDYFYTAFSTTSKENRWLKLAKYASSTLQGTRTQIGFRDAFIHEPDTNEWGFSDRYVESLIKALKRNKRELQGSPIPILELAIWMYRDIDFGNLPETGALIRRFVDEFRVKEQESALFDSSDKSLLFDESIFSRERVSWDQLKDLISSPPDEKPEKAGGLGLLRVRGVSPIEQIEFDAAPRLNLFTGDNGLGKSFLLETAWWALTDNWSVAEAVPQPDTSQPKTEPAIEFKLSRNSHQSELCRYRYNWRGETWQLHRPPRPILSGLAVYGKADGTCALWDSLGSMANPTVNRMIDGNRRFMSWLTESPPSRRDVGDLKQFANKADNQIVLNAQQIIYGDEFTEGLIRDWVRWQNSPDRYPFEVLRRVLERLSPPDLGTLKPGRPRRLSFERIEIPTIEHVYGEVPIVYVSAAIKRVVSLAYMIVWAWNEHVQTASRLRVEPERRIVILIDEIESHLHPQWQRTILPALMEISSLLSDQIQVQYLISTHSPLVMASIEPLFNDESDRQFHVKLLSTGDVVFEQKDFVEHGLVDYWLTSPTFNLGYPGSAKAEETIQKAKRLQLSDSPSPSEIRAITKELERVLAAEDPYWISWTMFTEAHGLEL